LQALTAKNMDGESRRRGGESFHREVSIDEIINPDHLVIAKRPGAPVVGPHSKKRGWGEWA
jgi:hypothetical protein